MKARKTTRQAARQPLFSRSRIGSAVAMALIATGAQAADTKVDAGYVPSVTGNATVNGSSGNTGTVNATVNGAVVGTTSTGTPATPNPSQMTTSGNLIGATAGGNAYAKSIAAPLNNDGALGVSTNTGAIDSLVTASKMAVESNVLQSGSVVNTDNTISAATTLNSGSLQVSGTAAAGPLAPQAGSATLNFPSGTPIFDAKGNVAVTNLQSATGPSASARVTGNTIDLLLTTNAPSITAATALDRNAVLAVFKGNSASNTAEIQAGGSPSFAGSAVVSNLQVNGNGILAATQSAQNAGSVVMGIVSGLPMGGTNRLQGSLSVQGNTLSSAATGNEALGATAGTAGNRILVDGVSVAGSGTAATAANNSTHTGVGVVTNVKADLAIVNSQGNLGIDFINSGITASTTGGQVLAGAESTSGATITLANNGITAAANGNTASSAIDTGQNAASFAGTAALSNQQANSGTPVSGLVGSSVIAAQTGDGLGHTLGSTVSVAGNTSSASGQGNQITQSLTLDANTVALGNSAVTLTGGTSADGRVSAAGAATVTNLQGNYGSPVGGTNINPQIALLANGGGQDITGSTLSVTGNRQEAVGVGSGATNTLSIGGNAVGIGAGIASVQMGDATSPVGAGLSDAQTRITASTNVTGGTLALTGNLQRAIGYGNSVSNALAVTAGNIAAPFGLGQSASVRVTGGSLPLDNNAATQPTVTAAYGVLNDQSMQQTVNTSATGTNTMMVNVGGNVTNAGVANSRNTVVSASYGNDAASGIALDVNNVANATPLVSGAVANVTNVQTVGANTIVSALAAGGAVERTIVSGNLSGSSVASSANLTEALAYGSRATGNTVSVKANNIDNTGILLGGVGGINGSTTRSAAGALGVTAAFGVLNAQSGQGSVSAVRSGGPEVLTQIGGGVTNASVTAGGNSVIAAATSNSAVNGVSVDAANVSTTTAVQNAQFTAATVTSKIGQESASLNDKSGVQVAVGGGVSGAQVAVDGNIASGSATGNVATNGIDVKGNTVAGGNVLFPLALVSNNGGAINVTADNALSNIQFVNGTAPISAKAATAFGVDTAPGAVITGATLSASGNQQNVDALANAATNSIAVAGTSVSARSALQSNQASAAAVEARAFIQVFAPAAVAASSVKIDGNANVAQAAVNDVSNKLNVAADSTPANPFGISASVASNGVPANMTASGDQVIVNHQTASTSASSTANTALYNEDRAVPSTTGLVGSAFEILGNGTVSGATANRATNASTLAGGATQAAKTAVLNTQESSAVVSAVAANVTRLTLTGTNALNASSATLGGNSTDAAATGNAATNSLSVSGSTVAGTGTAASAQTGPTSTIAVSADQALGNVQVGTGAISATATGSIGVRTAALSSVSGSTLAVTGNSQSAKAVANTADNTVSLAGANVAARSALQSTQSGTAPVTATSTLELFAPAASSASTIRLSNNSNTALGVINDVTNTLGVAATNVRPGATTGSVTLTETGNADNVTATGDQVLSNRQTAASSVNSTASTALYNDDRGVAGTQGLLNGALTISGNSTFAEASANRAANTVSVAADATQSASAGIVNVQGSSAVVTASAITTAGATLAGASPLNGSSVSLDGNTTAALARGNSATNVLDTSAGSGYGSAAQVGSSALVGTSVALNLGASAGVLNSQTNSGAVSASSVGTSYQVALNTVGGAGVTNGTVGVTGNTLAAQAYGNSATNRVTQTALNTGAPSTAVANYQVNTGAVTATVTSVNFGVGVSGAVGNSALRTTGNQITASATGNASVSSITAR